MVAFISYFFALFLRASPGQIPVLAVAVAVGLGASLFVRTLIFPDRPRAEVRHLLRALRGASISVLRTLTVVLETVPPIGTSTTWPLYGDDKAG